MISSTKRLWAAAVALLCALSFAAPAMAAGGTTSDVPAATTPLSGNEVFFCDQGGVTHKCKASDVSGVTTGGPHTWVGTQTFPGVVLNGVTGSYQCIQADTAGTLGGVAMPCSGGPTRSQIATLHLGANQTILTSGDTVAGDSGTDCAYTSVGASSGGLRAIQDASGTWFNLVANGSVRAGCLGVKADYSWASVYGSISGTTLTLSSAANVFNIGTVAIGQSVTGPGVTANTVITGGSGNVWTVNNSQTVGPITMVMSAGTDDATAQQAALTTGLDVLMNGPAPTVTSLSLPQVYTGVSAPLSLPQVNAQRVTASSAALAANKAFAGGNGYVISTNAARQKLEDLTVDAGQMSGVQAGGIFIGGSSGVSVINPIVTHCFTVCINLAASSGDLRLINADCGEWGNQQGVNNLNGVSTGHYDVSQNVGTCLKVSRADSQVLGGIFRYSGIGIDLACPDADGSGGQSTWFSNIHVYNGVNNAAVPFPGPVNIHSCGTSPGSNMFNGVYQDNGSSEIYQDSIGLLNVWFNSLRTASVLKNGSFTNVYANGQPTPFKLTYSFPKVAVSAGCVLTGSASGTTLTVSSVALVSGNQCGSNPVFSSGSYDPVTGLVTIVSTGIAATLSPGQLITVSGATGTGSFASINGTYAVVSRSGFFNSITYQIAANLTLTISGATLWVDGGYLQLGELVQGTGIPVETYITAIGTRWNGTTGSYTISNSVGATGSESITIGAYTAVKFLDNPNTIAVTGASGDGVHATLTVAAWGNDTPQPGVNGTITVAGFTGGSTGYNCSRCLVTAATSTSVSYASTAVAALAGSPTIQENWTGDFSGVNDRFVTGGQQWLQGAGGWIHTVTGVGAADIWYQSRAANSDPYGVTNPQCINMFYEFATTGSLYHECHALSNAYLQIGAGVNIPSGIQLGDGTNKPTWYSDASNNSVFAAGGSDRWQINTGGSFRPTTDNATAIGTTAFKPSVVYSYQYNVAANAWVSSTAPSVYNSTFGTSPSITGHSADFRINVGTGGTASTGTLTMPFVAANHWDCMFRYLSPTAAEMLLTTEVSAEGTTTATISSGTYDNLTGAVSLTLGTAANIKPGQQFTVSGATGTGNFASINGTNIIATASSTGTTLNYTIAAGLTMTITGGTVTFGTVTLTSYTTSSGAATAWPASAVLMGRCGAY